MFEIRGDVRAANELEVEMLKRKTVQGTNQLRVTFALRADDPRLPAAVVGEFNGWNPDENPMRPRSNGTWSAVVTLDKGRSYRFRYRSEDGQWFNEDGADGYEGNEFNATNCVVMT